MRDIERDFRIALKHIAERPIDPRDVTEEEMTLFVHLYQIVRLVQTSTWGQSRKDYVNKDSSEINIDFSEQESFLFAAVLLRQIYGSDHLLERAIESYQRHCDRANVRQWISNEMTAFQAVLDDPCECDRGTTFRDLLDSILYGALILHAPHRAKRRHCERFHSLIQKGVKRGDILSAAHNGLWLLYDRAFHIAALIHADVAKWWYGYREIPKSRYIGLRTLFEGERPFGLIPTTPNMRSADMCEAKETSKV